MTPLAPTEGQTTVGDKGVLPNITLVEASLQNEMNIPTGRPPRSPRAERKQAQTRKRGLDPEKGTPELSVGVVIEGAGWGDRGGCGERAVTQRDLDVPTGAAGGGRTPSGTGTGEYAQLQGGGEGGGR